MRHAARTAALTLLVAPLLAAACHASAQSEAPPDQASKRGAGARPTAATLAGDMPAVVTDYSADRRSVRDFYTIDTSATRLEREDRLALGWKIRLNDMDFDALDQAGRIDWLLLQNEIEHGRQSRRARRFKLYETDALLPFAEVIVGLEQARWQLVPVDPERAAQRLDQLAKCVKAARARVDAGREEDKPKGDDAKNEQASAEDAKSEDSESKATADGWAAFRIERVVWPELDTIDFFMGMPMISVQPADSPGGEPVLLVGTVPEEGLDAFRERLRRMRELWPDSAEDFAVLLLPSALVDAKALQDVMTLCQEEGVTKFLLPEHWRALDDAAPLATTPIIARRAASEIDGLRSALETWFRHYDQFAPGFSWWTRKPYDAAIEALNDYAKLLREEVAGLKGKDEDPLVGDPIGRQALVDDLAGELIAYSPEELLAIGEREFAWCEEQLQIAAAEMGFGADWKAALAKVKEDHVDPGAQDALVAGQAKEAIAFLDEHELITVPELCRETWRVRMIDENTQKTLPYAAYGGQDMLVAYPTSDMDTDTKLMTMRGNNVHFSRIVVPHELIPGHHLQGYVASRSNAHRREFSTPFLGEGWALYWELRLWDLGYAQSPEDRIGMLFWRMHRAARIIVSLKFHLGEMQPQEMIDFLVERVGHEKAGATSEVRRYIGGDYGPLYQCAYMIGGLQLRALHDELVGGDGAAGGGAVRMTERQFHDAVLEQNGIPVELIRAALTGARLTRHWNPSWRFAGEVEAPAAGPTPAAPR